MASISHLIKTTGFSVGEAEFATVGDFWKNIVFFYKHDRLYYVTHGEADLILKGTTLHLHPNRLYYIPSYSVITANCNTFMSHHFIHFEFEGMQKNFFYSLQLKMETAALEGDELLFKRIEKLMAERSGKVEKDLEINGIMQILLSRFLADTEIKENKNLLRFSDVMTYIENNLDKKITVRDLANYCNLNEVYFSNSFTKSVGISPSQFVIEKKLARSMILLRDEKISVKEIAFALGFNNELYFSRLFKKKTGLPPSKFRKNVKTSKHF